MRDLKTAILNIQRIWTNIKEIWATEDELKRMMGDIQVRLTRLEERHAARNIRLNTLGVRVTAIETKAKLQAIRINSLDEVLSGFIPEPPSPVEFTKEKLKGSYTGNGEASQEVKLEPEDMGFIHHVEIKPPPVPSIEEIKAVIDKLDPSKTCPECGQETCLEILREDAEDMIGG